MNKKRILLILFLVLMIISGKSLVEWKLENKTVKNIIKKEEKKIITENGVKHLDKTIKKDNKYTIGWLIVDGTKINYPVLQYKDNEYYLTHDFDNQKNSAGWIFMDYQNKLDDQNIIIYGHHRRDGSMFGSIDELYKTNNKNLYITFITNNQTIKYKIFSVYKTQSTDTYNNRYFDNFTNTIHKFVNRSEKKFDNNEFEPKQIITLSTCSNDNLSRIVVHAYVK